MNESAVESRPLLTVPELEAERMRLVGVVQSLRLAAIRSRPAWQCSGCEFVLRGSAGRDARCPSCGGRGYLSGSVDPAALEEHDAAALAAMGDP